MLRPNIIAASIALLVIGCHGSFDTSEDTRVVINGQPTLGFPTVFNLETVDAGCTAVMVSERVALTAAHCLKQTALNPENLAQARAEFGSTVRTETPERTVAVVAAVAHRYYDVDDETFYDVGLVLLSEDPAVGFMAISAQSPSELLGAGDMVRFVGFGRTSAFDADSWGVKHETEIRYTGSDTGQSYFLSFPEGGQTCSGDSRPPDLPPAPISVTS